MKKIIDRVLTNTMYKAIKDLLWNLFPKKKSKLVSKSKEKGTDTDVSFSASDSDSVSHTNALPKSKTIGLLTGAHQFHVKIMTDNNAELFNMGKWPQRFINEFIKLPDGDVYITESNFYAPIIIKKLLQKKKVTVINIAGSPSIFKINNMVMKWLMNMIDVMLVEGKFGEEQIRKAGYKGKTQIIYPDYYDKPLERIKCKDPSTKLKIFCMANNSWKIKGLDILEKAIYDVECEVYVAGKSSYVSQNYKLTMLGELNNSQIQDLFSKCNLYIQPSRFDTFSISVLEAAYNGLPVLVSDKCGVKEFVKEPFIFKDEIYLNYLLKNKKLVDTFMFDEFEKVDKSLVIKL